MEIMVQELSLNDSNVEVSDQSELDNPGDISLDDELISIIGSNESGSSVPDFENLKKVLFEFTEKEKNSIMLPVNIKNKSLLWISDNVILTPTLV